MRLLAAILFGAAAALTAAQDLPQSYFLLVQDDGRTWCAYQDSAEFKSVATSQNPLESAAVVYSSGKLVALAYQTEAESGDWIVVDKYTASNDEILLRRTNLLTQENLQIIQETSIHRGNAGPLRLVSVSTLDGGKAEPSNVDFPAVPLRTNLLSIPFVQMVDEMRQRGLGKLCKKLD
jgi:hypothetical protein